MRIGRKEWLAHGDQVGEAAALDAVNPSQDEALETQEVFRAFSPSEFHKTPTWHRLLSLLRANGGCYGLYGPRGVGKSWLMMMMIHRANANEGIGLWFPCPSEYDPSEFLSSLSDNLANAVERRLVRDNRLLQGLRSARSFLIPIFVVLLLLVVIEASVGRALFHILDEKLYSSGLSFTFLFWWVAGTVAAILIFIYIAEFAYAVSKKGRLVREATALRERIRFTTSLRLGAEISISGGNPLAAAFKRTRDKALDERPTTVASLVFDFRNLAELIANTVHGPVVIGIDELDKIENADAVRKLLRDVKGIFEVTGVHFLVSVSEEAMAALQLGTLRSDGRNEFNSSFYTVITLPSLDPDEALELLCTRGFHGGPERATALCLLAGGNQRELIRMADMAVSRSSGEALLTYDQIICAVLRTESLALLHEVIWSSGNQSSTRLSDDARSAAWESLPEDSYSTVGKFIALGKRAIHEFWQPEWRDEPDWKSLQESWKRLLIRLFVSASVLEDNDAGLRLLSDKSAIVDLRDVMLMARHDAGVAKLMLEARFGKDLRKAYRPSGLRIQV